MSPTPLFTSYSVLREQPSFLRSSSIVNGTQYILARHGGQVESGRRGHRETLLMS